MLWQPNSEGRLNVIFLLIQEENFSKTENEFLDVILEFEKSRALTKQLSVEVMTDYYGLKGLNNLKVPTELLDRWSLGLQNFDVYITHQKRTNI
ncbi:hypothetical protein HHI36_015274 [Cryptolaemus montrouzieri]|uniref:Reverse transcriptase RNase H-like domain-containing protein n=1 Tax=Cryptolaemus montrouzieri TaxID=559131 RepID=A0ABD2N5F4_9CUCU